MSELANAPSAGAHVAFPRAEQAAVAHVPSTLAGPRGATIGLRGTTAGPRGTTDGLRGTTAGPRGTFSRSEEAA